MARVYGNLELSIGNCLSIVATFGNGQPTQSVLDSASTYTQIPRDLGAELGLRGHQLLIGRSQTCDGGSKEDFLAACDVAIEGVVVPLVIKVVEIGQPILIGLDLMMALRMNVDLDNMTFNILPQPNFHQPKCNFHFLSIDKIMQRLHIVTNDLVPISQLPQTASIALGQTILAGGAVFVETLGFSAHSLSSPHSAVNLGTSYHCTCIEAV